MSDLNLVGGAGDDVLDGGTGNDTIDGGAGADTLRGQAGNDTYFVDNPLDLVVENADEGTDTVIASVSYVLGANVEHLALTGSAVFGLGNGLDNNLTGNGLANTLIGNDGADRLDGGTGADLLIGGSGNDTYVIDNAGDVITEASGTDTVESSISYVLAGDLENLVLTGGATSGEGNGGANVITGNSANNLLIGRGGADTIDGGAGIDTAQVAGSASITASGGHWTVVSSDGSDTLTNVEIVADAGGRTLLVGATGYASIQDAVDAAVSGDTIMIAAGTYREQVLITGKDLTIHALDGAVLEMPDQANIVSSGGYNAALTVVGADVDVINLDIDGRGQGGVFASQTFAGVALINADGSSFADGHITGFHAAPAQAGSQHGYGILVRGTDGGSHHVEISGNTIDDFQKNGIDVREAGASTDLTVDVHDNQIAGWGATGLIAQNGVVVGFGATGVIADNTVSAIGYTGSNATAAGVLVYQGDGVDVIGNEVTMAGTTTSSSAISLFDSEPGTITGNTVDNAAIGFEQTGDFTTAANVGANGFGSLGANFSFDPSDGAATGYDAHGTAGDDVLDGGAGDDVLDGGAGDDTLVGGAGNDTAHVTGTASFVDNGSDWTVTSSDGVDTLIGVEIAVDSGGRTLLVGSGGFATIQAAVDAAENGDTILIADGTYTEQVLIDGLDNLTVKAADGAHVTIEAPADLASSGVFSSSDRSINAVVAVTNGSNVAIEGITVDGAGAGNSVDVAPGHGAANFIGVFYRNASGGLADVDITGVHDAYPGGTTVGGHPVQSGNQRGVGLQVDNDSLLGFFMHGGTIDDFQKNATAFNRAILDVSGVTIVGGGAQTINAQNGFQVGNSTGSISGNTVSGIGYAGPQVVSATGILLFHNTGLAVTNNTITGANDETTAAQVAGIYVYDNGGPNSGGSITGNTISHVDQGIALYGDVTGAMAIHSNSVTSVDVTDPFHAGIDFEPDSSANFTVEGTAAGDTLLGSNGDDTLSGLAGDDSLAGGGGNDALDGGADHDTAGFAGARAGYDLAVTTDNGFVTSFTGVTDTDGGNGDEGHDSLTSVEALAFDNVTLDLNDMVQLFSGGVLTGTFDTLAAAMTAAADGDTIRIGEGTLVGDATISKAVTILGADAGTVATGRDPSDGSHASNLVGHFKITATGDVTIDGVRFVNTAATTHGGPSNPTLQIQTGGGPDGHVVRNSVFWSEVVGGANGVDDRAIATTVIGAGNIVITGNVISGVSEGLFGTASWGRGIWFDGGGADLTVTGNRIEWTRSGLNLDMTGDSTATVAGNSFHGLGTGVAVGVDSAGVGLFNNDYSQVGDDFNFRNLSDPVTFDAGTAVDTLTPHDTDSDPIVILGGAGGDHLTGTGLSDLIIGNDLSASATDADELRGAGGNDVLLGKGGDDTLYGDGGNDHLDGGAGIDTAMVTGAVSLDANGSQWTVTSADGTDTLVNVEVVVSGAARTLLVGSGGFATLQAAVDEAHDGDTIMIAAGTYTGDATIDVDVTILGANDGIAGDGVRGGESNLSGLITITASGVTIDGVAFSGESTPAGVPWPAGVYVTGNDVSIANSVFDTAVDTPGGTDTVGLVTGPVTGLEVSDSLFSGYAIGAYVSGGDSTGSFHDNLFQGGWSAGDPGNFFGLGNGVNSESSHVAVVDNQFDALYAGAVQVLAFGPAAIAIDDFVHGNSFTDGRAARPIQIYPNGDVTSVVGSDESEAFNGDQVAGGRAFDFQGNGGHDRLYGGDQGDTLSGGAGDDGLFGNGGNDSLDGGLGADALDGGAGTDTATFDGTLTAADFSYSGGNWHVGGDSLEGVEVVTDGSGHVFHLVGADGTDGYATIQAAVNAAASGDTVLVAPGTYNENVVIGTDGLTLLSVDGRATTIIAGVQAGSELGAIQLAAGADGITIGGDDAGFTIQGINGNGAVEKAAVYFQGTHDDVTIVGNEVVANGDLGMVSEYNQGVTNIVITGNVFSGVTFTGGYVGTGDQFAAGNNVARQLVALGGGSNLGPTNPSHDVTFTDNEVSGTAGGETGPGTGVFAGNQLVTIDASNSLVEGNLFSGNTEGNGLALRTRGSGTDVIDNDLTGQSLGISVDHQGTPGSYSGNTLHGTAVADLIGSFTPGSDVIAGGNGDDVLAGGLGNDAIDGGAGSDTAVFSGNFSAYTIDYALDGGGNITGFNSVSGPDGTDTLTSIEKLAFLGSGTVLTLTDPVQLFSGGNLVGTFTSIQAAIDTAGDGDTILVGAGTYDPFTVDVAVTIRGTGAVVIEGDFRATNAVPDGTTVGEWLQTAPGYGGGGVGATIAADGVTLEGLSFTGLLQGVSIGGSDNLTLTDVDISDSVYGVVKFGDTDAHGFEMTGGSITDSYQGFTVDSGGGTNAAFDDVLLDGVTFENLTEKGFYADNLSDAQLLHLVMTNVGEFGRGPAFGAAGVGEYGAGIDINLKYGDYSNIEIGGFDFTDVGSSSTPDSVPLDYGAAITIKARDDGSYTGNPATLTNVTVHDGTIDGTATGVRIGEPGKGNAGPSGVTVTNVTITGADVAAFDNASQATLTVTGTSGADGYNTGATTVGSVDFSGGTNDDTLAGGGANDSLAGGDGDDTLNGGGGNDILHSGDGSDVLTGGSGFDIAYLSASTSLIATPLGWINSGPDGNDVLIGIELAIAPGQRQLLVGATAFATVGAAMGSSLVQNGDFIMLAGTQSGSFAFTNSGLTVLGQGGTLNATFSSVANFGITVFGGNVSDVITTGGGNDVIDGRGGADTMTGLGGDDWYFVDNAADVVNEIVGGGANDRVFASASYALGAAAQIEWLTATDELATTALNLTGNGFAQTIVGNAGANVLSGGGGNDVVNGGAGADTLNGGDGNDQIFVDNAGDVVGELTGEGTDIVFASVSYTLTAGAWVEGLQTTDVAGTGAINLTGNELAQTIRGNAGANTLDGGAGNDSVFGNAGNDQLIGGLGIDATDGGLGDDQHFVDSAADIVIERAGEGSDTVYSTASYTLAAAAEVENLQATDAAATAAINLNGNDFVQAITGNAGLNTLRGFGGNDTLSGLGGNDQLDGGVGVDTTVGGAGHDYHFVDNAGDVVIELAGEGTDIVYASVSYALGAGAYVEGLQTRDAAGTDAINLTGNGFANTIRGNAGINVVDGGAGDDSLFAYAGNDQLIGGLGVDVTDGGAGDDQHFVDNAGDIVIERAGEGSDAVYASVSYTISTAAEVELLSTANQAATDALNLNGNGFAQTITGNAGANTLRGYSGTDTLNGLAGNDQLDGGAGTDTTVGGAGNDLHFVDNAGDVVVELAGEGTDVVYASVSYTLGAGASVEGLQTNSAAGTTAINLTGNELAQTVVGNAGANVLNGGAGADVLTGLAGADSFAFTTALGAGNIDKITDYSVVDDTIRLDDSVFTGLALGALSAGAFNTGSAATQADDRIIYNAATGALFFDADGLGGVAAVQFATISPGLAMAASEFQVI